MICSNVARETRSRRLIEPERDGGIVIGTNQGTGSRTLLPSSRLLQRADIPVSAERLCPELTKAEVVGTTSVSGRSWQILLRKSVAVSREP